MVAAIRTVVGAKSYCRGCLVILLSLLPRTYSSMGLSLKSSLVILMVAASSAACLLLAAVASFDLSFLPEEVDSSRGSLDQLEEGLTLIVIFEMGEVWIKGWMWVSSSCRAKQSR